MGSQSAVQTFSDERLDDWIVQARDNYQVVCTPFLDERQCHRLATMAIAGVQWDTFGGYVDAERRRVVFVPEYDTITAADYHITPVTITYREQFGRLSHSDILGALTGLGLDRKVIGDIVVTAGACQCFLADEVVAYVLQELQHVGRHGVTVTRSERLLVPPVPLEPVTLLVATCRVDTVIAQAFNLSRTQAKELCHDGQVQYNWLTTTKPDQLVDRHATLSVRGYGRVEIQSVTGVTKKNKIKLSAIIKKR